MFRGIYHHLIEALERIYSRFAQNVKIAKPTFSTRRAFSSPEPTILLACGRDRELWRDPIFWACAEYSFRILNQSDLLDLTISPWIADFRCWTKPELSIPATGQKDRGLWGRECTTSCHQDDSVSMRNMSPLWKFTSGRVLQPSRLGS